MGNSPGFSAGTGHGVVMVVMLLLVPICCASCGLGKEPAALPMKLVVLEAPEYSRQVVFDRPTAATVRETVESLSWKEITFVVLEVDSENWLEFSGGSDPSDGFSARYMEDGREFVIVDPPSSTGIGIALLQLYLVGDEGWRSLSEWC